MAGDFDKDWIRTCLGLPMAPWTTEAGAIDDALPAAVLIPIVERGARLHVILTRRSDGLRHHAGQISFPGGRIDPGDASIESAALREMHEEVGVAPSKVEVIGRLPRYRTGTGFLVHPVVGFVDPGEVLRANPAEVDEIFEAPLEFLVDPANQQPHYHEHRGQRVRLLAIPYQDYYIWGATAAMLSKLSNVLRSPLVRIDAGGR